MDLGPESRQRSPLRSRPPRRGRPPAPPEPPSQRFRRRARRSRRRATHTALRRGLSSVPPSPLPAAVRWPYRRMQCSPAPLRPERGYAVSKPSFRPRRPQLPPSPALVSSFPAIPVRLAHTASERQNRAAHPLFVAPKVAPDTPLTQSRNIPIDPDLVTAKCRTRCDLLQYVRGMSTPSLKCRTQFIWRARRRSARRLQLVKAPTGRLSRFL